MPVVFYDGRLSPKKSKMKNTTEIIKIILDAIRSTDSEDGPYQVKTSDGVTYDAVVFMKFVAETPSSLNEAPSLTVTIWMPALVEGDLNDTLDVTKIADILVFNNAEADNAAPHELWLPIE